MQTGAKGKVVARFVRQLRRDAVRVAGFASLLAVMNFLFWGGAFSAVSDHPYGISHIFGCFSIPSALVLGAGLLALGLVGTRQKPRAPKRKHGPSKPEVPTGGAASEVTTTVGSPSSAAPSPAQADVLRRASTPTPSAASTMHAGAPLLAAPSPVRAGTLAATFLIVGLVGLAALLGLPEAHPALLVLAACIIGLGLALGLHAWSELFARLDPASVVTVTGSACVTFPLVAAVVRALPAVAAFALVGALACLAGGALVAPVSRSGCNEADGAPDGHEGTAPGRFPNGRAPGSQAATAIGRAPGAQAGTSTRPAPGSRACTVAGRAPGSLTSTAAKRSPSSPTGASAECAPGDPGSSPARGPLPSLRELLSSYGTQIASFGALGFIAGFARVSSLGGGADSQAVAVGTFVGIAVVGALVLGRWYLTGKTLTAESYYLLAFPVAASGFVLFTLLDMGFSSAFAWFADFFFEFMLIVVAIDGTRGGHGPSRFCVAAGTAFVLVGAGTVVGWAVQGLLAGGVASFGIAVVVCVYTLSMPLALQLGWRNRKGTARDAGASAASAPDFPVSGPSAFSFPGAGASAASPAALAAREAALDAAAARFALTPREREILGLTLEGVDSPGVAAALGLSDNTVRTHKKSLYRKLDVHSKAELAAAVREAMGAGGTAPGDER